jgi:DNA helicase-2/ATP-dependent DNA helicase PcrA
MSKDFSYLNDLNEVQRKAVEYCDGPELVIASAGSGKTRVLTYKIAHLLNIGYQPWNIMALTFTNKAANVMKERIDKLIGEGSSKALWMGTFHSVFLRILRIEHEAVGFSNNFTIYDQADSESLIKTIVKENNLDEKVYKPSVVLSRISMAKSRLITPDKYMADQQGKKMDNADNIPFVPMIYKSYAERCRKANAMDFDDILLFTFQLFRDYPEILNKYATRFQFLLVDEYQDTNFAQHAIVFQLTSVHKKLCVVGDDAQSIYSFRGASISNILKFNETYPDYKIFKLEQNYRSTQCIVNAANSIIAKNQFRIEKNAYSDNESGNPVSIYETSSDQEEGYSVINKIILLHKNEHLDFNSFAILYRTNAQSRIFEEALRKNNIPYIIYGGLSFYKRKEIKDVIAYFRLVVNHDDEEAFKRIVNYPARGIGKTTLAKLIECANYAQKSVWEVIEQPETFGLKVSKATLAKLNDFKELIHSFTQLAMEKDAYEVGREIIIQAGISTDLYSDMSEEGKTRQENLEELVNALSTFRQDKIEEGDQHVSLVDYLSEVSLMSDIDATDDDQKEAVKLMTVHAAKGLEFHTVFVVGVEEDLFPSKRTNTQKEIEEERRLFYVAITRAEKYCFISYAKARYRYGNMEFSVPSRFIHEIDSRFVKKANGVGQGYTSKRKTARFDSLFESSAALFPRKHDKVDADRLYVDKPKPQSPGTLRPLKYSDNPFNSTTASHTESVTTNNKYGISVGDRIKHERFGLGTILKIEGNDENCKATVQFDNLGTKQLLLKFAKFTKL